MSLVCLTNSPKHISQDNIKIQDICHGILLLSKFILTVSVCWFNSTWMMRHTALNDFFWFHVVKNRKEFAHFYFKGYGSQQMFTMIYVLFPSLPILERDENWVGLTGMLCGYFVVMLPQWNRLFRFLFKYILKIYWHYMFAWKYCFLIYQHSSFDVF